MPFEIQREVAFYSENDRASGLQAVMKSNQFQKAIISNENSTFIITAFIPKTAQNAKKNR